MKAAKETIISFSEGYKILFHHCTKHGEQISSQQVVIAAQNQEIKKLKASLNPNTTLPSVKEEKEQRYALIYTQPTLTNIYTG